MAHPTKGLSLIQPLDHNLFVFCSTLTEAGLAYLKEYVAQKRYIRTHEDLPTVDWSVDGMPQFRFYGNEKPDYTTVFHNWFGAVASVLGDAQIPEFDIYTHPAFQELKKHVRSSPQLSKQFFTPRDEDKQPDLFSTSIATFVEIGIDRYVHTFHDTTFNPDNYLDVYLPREACLLQTELPIEIQVPILSALFPDDVFPLVEGVAISKMSTHLQLARAYQHRESHEINRGVLEEASHALVLSNYVIPNLSRFERQETLSNPNAFPLDIIDTLFACLRIITSVQTGYAQLLIVPVGWAAYYVADLQPLEGMTVRKYPPTLQPASALFGESAPKISASQLEATRELFASLISLYSDNKKAHRLPLVIRRLNSCHLREDEEDAILDATIGLEILLSDGSTQEITHKLALRLAALSALVPGYEKAPTKVFHDVKSAIYPYRSAVAHGDLNKAGKKREIKTGSGEAIPVVKLATEYLGMALRAVAAHPQYLDPSAIDENLLLRSPLQ